MTQEHPITPPPALVQQWLGEYFGTTVSGEVSDVELVLATRAARWGADQELEACIRWLDTYVPRYCEWSANFRDARRTASPPSLKEEALLALAHLDKGAQPQMDTTEASNAIRRALESLHD